LITDKLSLLHDILIDKKFVYPHTPLSEIIQLFSQYNLRVIPVVDENKKPIGIILIDDVLKRIEEEQEKDENL
jgi:Mg/Co/Ni transporter MgtE